VPLAAEAEKVAEPQVRAETVAAVGVTVVSVFLHEITTKKATRRTTAVVTKGVHIAQGMIVKILISTQLLSSSLHQC
jgi:hypothetical protein